MEGYTPEEVKTSFQEGFWGLKVEGEYEWVEEDIRLRYWGFGGFWGKLKLRLKPKSSFSILIVSNLCSCNTRKKTKVLCFLKEVTWEKENSGERRGRVKENKLFLLRERERERLWMDDYQWSGKAGLWRIYRKERKWGVVGSGEFNHNFMSSHQVQLWIIWIMGLAPLPQIMLLFAFWPFFLCHSFFILSFLLEKNKCHCCLSSFLSFENFELVYNNNSNQILTLIWF